MTSIDERVVSMQLKNGQFLNGIAATINAMASLKQSLNLNGAKTGIEQVSQAMARIPPGSIATGIESVSAKFIAMSAVAIAGLERITNAAITTGVNLLKSLTVDPIKAGLEEYETNLSSIQTILANTGLEGDKGLGKVEAALQKLNHYSDQTIYNFSEMAKNIGTFTAAGIDLDTSTEAIKGIANLAAVSGSNAQQASTAMYQLSQSLSSGRVTLEDWNSVVNAGMGGKVFQESLKETAKVHGVAVDSIIKEQGSFRNSLQEGWITSEILTETLSKFTGDLTKSQLKTMGYNEEQIRGIRKMGETATDAATKVKTMSQLISTLQETAQSGWAKTWETIFGDFDEAKALFTEVNNVLGEMIGASSDSRNKLLKDWAKLGGRTAIIEAISNAFNGLIEVTEPIRDAFTDIFPPATAEQLFAISESIRDFTETIKIGAADAENLRRTFAGVFAVFSIAGSILKGLITLLTAGDLRAPVRVGVVDLADLLDALHEPRELLELRPLVVDRTDGYLHVDRLRDAGHEALLSSGSFTVTRAGLTRTCAGHAPRARAGHALADMAVACTCVLRDQPHRACAPCAGGPADPPRHDGERARRPAGRHRAGRPALRRDPARGRHPRLLRPRAARRLPPRPRDPAPARHVHPDRGARPGHGGARRAPRR